jgi:hypothetical protein
MLVPVSKKNRNYCDIQQKKPMNKKKHRTKKKHGRKKPRTRDRIDQARFPLNFQLKFVLPVSQPAEGKKII